MIPGALFLGTSSGGQLILIVCIVVVLVGFGACWIIVAQALRRERDENRRKLQSRPGLASSRRLATHSGPLPMKAAAWQILLIPASVAVGLSLLALIDVIVRA